MTNVIVDEDDRIRNIDIGVSRAVLVPRQPCQESRKSKKLQCRDDGFPFDESPW